ncbi:MAG TPA: hypothetical protein VF228_09380 [Iamia sp.]
MTVLLLAGCTSGGDATGDPAPPSTVADRETGPGRAAEEAGGPEPVDLHVVPLPATVTGARFPSWSADGERIVFSGRPDGSERDEVMAVAEDGSDLVCLTCGVAPGDDRALLKPVPFTDGRRIAVRVGEQSPVSPADHAVLECRPSVADCAAAELVPIVPPAADDPEVRQDQREVRVAPDGETVALSQVRARPEGDAALLSVVGTLRRTATAYVVDDARVVSTLGELKAFTPDGQAVLVAAFTTLVERAANPDIVRVDLGTGAVEAVTVDGDYDEDISLAPDQRSYVVASGRGADLFETVSQLRRPAFVGPGLEPLTAYLFAHHRRELLEPWVVPVGAEADGEEGQQLNPDSAAEGYDGRTLMTWHPEGDRVLFWEGGSDPFGPPEGETRLVVARLTDRDPVEPDAPAASPSPAAWAPAVSGFAPPPLEPPSSRSGDVGGSATVTVRAGAEPGATVIEVRYDGFTDDGAWVVDGTESVTSVEGGLLGTTTYRADLTVTGDHEGFLRADAVIGTAGIVGSIESEVDGRHLRLPR